MYQYPAAPLTHNFIVVPYRRGSGCQFDHEHVWTSDLWNPDDWTSSAKWPITTAAPRANEFSPDGITTTTTEATLGWTTTDTGITDM